MSTVGAKTFIFIEFSAENTVNQSNRAKFKEIEGLAPRGTIKMEKLRKKRQNALR